VNLILKQFGTENILIFGKTGFFSGFFGVDVGF
jgi:hypothetical protein